MTTPAERTLRNGLLDRPEDDTHLRTLMNNLRPAGVGEAVDCSHCSVYDRLLTFIHDRDCALRGDESTDPTEIDEAVLAIMQIATPAHPDAALMERVREGLVELRRWLRYDVPAGTIGATIALGTVNELLSDLKAEAGR